MPQANGWATRIRRTVAHTGTASRYGTAEFVDLAYRLVLGRPGDGPGVQLYAAELDAGRLDRDRFLRCLVDSDEYRDRELGRQSDEPDVAKRWLDALHSVRLRVIAGLPKAARILDLGGSCPGWPEGALVIFGYPYAFENLTIVDLPSDLRHEIYVDRRGEYADEVPTKLGPVRYLYASLADLDSLPDDSFDLVYSGQSIEHVTREDAARACEAVYRVLKPGGAFCLDTPNRAVTILECPDSFINPDHKYEYTHAELVELLRAHQFEIREAKGLCRFPESLKRGTLDYHEGLRNAHIYDDPESCYLLYYRCEKPA